ncbi:MAG: hypothetical protein H0V40_05930 [Actinobacteria bacterium]|nr:hypothetical protein [Actinomycetota bacterium]
MLRAAARRFAILLAAVAGGTIAVSLAAGLLLGSAADRSISVGLYLVGSFLLVAGFFVGNRGPARIKGDGSELPAAAGMFGIGVGSGRLRWATPSEREEALSNSAIFVSLGFALILLGVAADSRVHLL